MEAIWSSETSVGFQRATRRYSPECDNVLNAEKFLNQALLGPLRQNYFPHLRFEALFSVIMI
jgi:hypothetical protein